MQMCFGIERITVLKLLISFKIGRIHWQIYKKHIKIRNDLV